MAMPCRLLPSPDGRLGGDARFPGRRVHAGRRRRAVHHRRRVPGARLLRPVQRRDRGQSGGHRTTVQSALRKARELGLINRGRHGQRNLTNVVRIIAPEWLAWLQSHPLIDFPEADMSVCHYMGSE
jgi:hypothetical protein